MGFYFVMYVLVGIFMGVAARISTLRRENPAMLSMFWLNRDGPANNLLVLCFPVAPALALITSLLQGGFWVVVTAGEIALGALVSRAIPTGIALNITGMASAPTLILVFGAVWGFWYIPL